MDYFVTQGVFCVLLVILGIWAKAFITRIMDENKQRESEMRATIDKFGDIIKTELQEVKRGLKGRG